jgi:hypothetical protein
VETATTWVVAFLLVLAIGMGVARAASGRWERLLRWTPARRPRSSWPPASRTPLSHHPDRPPLHILPPAASPQSPHVRLLRTQALRRLRHHPGPWALHPPLRALRTLEIPAAPAAAAALPTGAAASAVQLALQIDQALLAACGADRIDLVHLGPDERGLRRNHG